MIATSLALPFFLIAMPFRFVLVLAVTIMPFALVPVPALSVGLPIVAVSVFAFIVATVVPRLILPMIGNSLGQWH
jgi:hypothetical protein